MKKSMIVAAALVAMVSVPALAQNAPTTYDLGAKGEISHWLMLGYFPLTVETKTYGSVLDIDLLPGGETKAQPLGGQKVKIAASATVPKETELAWQLAKAHPMLLPTAGNFYTRLHLFDDAKGDSLPKTGCYLYAELVAPADMTVTMMVGSDDSARVALNDKVVYRYAGQRGLSVNSEETPLSLKKGVNRLLARVDNYAGDGGFFCRLVDAHGVPSEGLKVQLVVPPGTADALTQPHAEGWEKIKGYIPAVKPAPRQELFGARLARTMALLESGPVTHRPVKIVFYGQSIEFGWNDMLVARLRERFPNTRIIAENHALGGWGVWLLVQAMKHDIVRTQPDLIFFHAYGGSPDDWERAFQTLRKETCADIITRTAHIAKYNEKSVDTVVDDETRMLTNLAAKYNVELVNLRAEWIDYLKDNKLPYDGLLCDPIHLNHKGSALMAQLYERHLNTTTLFPSEWMKSVRYYSAARPLVERRHDEITLEGKGWKMAGGGLQYTDGEGCRLKLKFKGNRLDLLIGAGTGGASVLIDGKAPSTMNLFHGTRPFARNWQMAPPANVIQYHLGKDMQAEWWVLTYKDISPDGKKFSFTVRGSRTGEDGAGTNTETFVSKSGRITIDPEDWLPGYHYPPPDLAKRPAPTLVWQIVPDHLDQVRSGPVPKDWPANTAYRQYLTVADGLPPGEHELTLTPDGKGSFTLYAAEAYDPPLGR